jgi:hypothetical protein
VKGSPRRPLFPVAWLVAAALLVAACGGSAGTSSPTPAPSPKPTPNPHLKEPARADTIYSTLVERGLGLIGTNASRGRDPAATINATYAGWPLVLIQYRSSQTRLKLHRIRSNQMPGRGDPPFTFAGMNVVVEWGPTVDGRVPRAVTKTQLADAQRLAAELDRLIGPLAERAAQSALPRAARPARPSPTP